MTIFRKNVITETETSRIVKASTQLINVFVLFFFLVVFVVLAKVILLFIHSDRGPILFVLVDVPADDRSLLKLGCGVGVQAIRLNSCSINAKDVLLIKIIPVAISTFFTTNLITIAVNIGIVATCSGAATILITSPPVPPLPLLLSLTVHTCRIILLLLLS